MEEVNKEIAELEKIIADYEIQQSKLRGERQLLTVQIESLEFKIRRAREQKRTKLLQLGVNNIVAEFLANNSNSKMNFQHIGKANGTYKDIWASCRKCRVDEMELFSVHDGLSEAIIAVCPKCKCEIDLTNLGNI